MGIEIVTGKRGSGHVTPDEDGNRNATFVGKESCVVDLYTGFELDIISANQAHIGRGVGYLQGRQFEVNAEGEDVVINSGTQGQNRNTVVYAHYTREPTTSVESVDLVVMDGTPTTGTPVDPEVNIGDLFAGELEAYFPLYRIVLEGVNIVSTDQLFDVKPLLMDAWDSVSHAPAWQNLSDACWYAKIGGMCVVQVDYLGLTAGTRKTIGVLPVGYRPTAAGVQYPDVVSATIMIRGANEVGLLSVEADGTVTAHSTKGSPGYFLGQVVFPCA